MSRLRRLVRAAAEAGKILVHTVYYFYMIYVVTGLGISAGLVALYSPVDARYARAIDIIVLVLFGLIVLAALLVQSKTDSARQLLPHADLTPLSTYSVHIAPSKEDTARGLDIFQDHFSDDTMPRSTFLNAQAKNPNCLVVAKMGAEVVGIGDFHGLENNAFDAFIEGTVGEPEIHPTAFLTRTEFARANRFYLGGISVATAWEHKEGEISQAIVMGMATAIHKAYSSERKEPGEKLGVYALGYTDEGIKALETFGFAKVNEATERRSSPLYFRTSTPREVRHLRFRPMIGNFEAKLADMLGDEKAA